jgi:hypothetical protein
MSDQYYRSDVYTIPGQHIREYANGTSNSSGDILKIAIKRYMPRQKAFSANDGITILACPGLGLSKELYEPLWDELYMYSARRKTFTICSIWIADFANQGASGIMNEDVLGIERAFAFKGTDLGDQY